MTEVPRSGHETDKERADRNFTELLQGARVAVTGVQVLFAFLLTVPFTERFENLREFDRWLFYVALVSAAIASICYIAPANQHRMLFRQGLKEKLVRRSNYYGIVGALALALSMAAATMLVVDFLFQSTLAWAWFGQPAFNRVSRGGDVPTPEQEESGRGDPGSAG